MTCCGVLLNFCVLEAALVADGDQFARLLERIQHLLPKLSKKTFIILVFLNAFMKIMNTLS